jgi:hypothetical protein
MSITERQAPATAGAEQKVAGRRPDGVGGPVGVAWREGTLTRAKELESLSRWVGKGPALARPTDDLLTAIDHHLDAARDAAVRRRRFGRSLDGSLLERAVSNLDAAEADLLQVAPAEYVLGQIPSLRNMVQRHLPPDDPRHQEFERLAASLTDSGPGGSGDGSAVAREEQLRTVDRSRNTIVSIVRGASSAALREQLRVRSFRAVLIATAVVMLLLAAALGLVGLWRPAALPLCFQPEQAGQQVVVCPTGQSQAVPTGSATGPVQPQVDALVGTTVRPIDVFLVEIVGLLAASIAAVAAIRRIRGSSEPHGLPVALAMLKLPTGAVTAVLGLLLMRGGFVPGLSALDSSAQIIAWAVLFGYAQQLFTRFIDQQARTVLDDVRGGGRSRGPAGPATD